MDIGYATQVSSAVNSRTSGHVLESKFIYVLERKLNDHKTWGPLTVGNQTLLQQIDFHQEGDGAAGIDTAVVAAHSEGAEVKINTMTIQITSKVESWKSG